MFDNRWLVFPQDFPSANVLLGRGLKHVSLVQDGRDSPRNDLAQQAIDAMAAGDASVLEKLMKVLERPYDEQPGQDAYAARRPEWSRNKAGCSALSCSS